MQPMIVLLTDFGNADPYVGQMKGALYSRVPDCRIVDLTHEVSPFGLAQAGFFLDASYRYFPEGTLFLTVVDPGVGGPRRIICLEAHGMLFLAPDNGLLGLVLDQAEDAHAYDISTPFFTCACSTFHGRDIFAPLAAQLCAGDSPESMGRELPLESLVRLDWSAPQHGEAGIAGHALHVDRFGNVITNLRIATWREQLQGEVSVQAGVVTLPLRAAKTYCEIPRGELGLIAGSQGFIERPTGRRRGRPRCRPGSPARPPR